MPDETRNKSVANTDEGSLELTEELIRVRAYLIYERRGYEHGHDLEDWVQAEAEIMGKKPSASTEPGLRWIQPNQLQRTG